MQDLRDELERLKKENARLRSLTADNSTLLEWRYTWPSYTHLENPASVRDYAMRLASQKFADQILRLGMMSAEHRHIPEHEEISARIRVMPVGDASFKAFSSWNYPEESWPDELIEECALQKWHETSDDRPFVKIPLLPRTSEIFSNGVIGDYGAKVMRVATVLIHKDRGRPYAQLVSR
jgi:hypothetical protein